MNKFKKVQKNIRRAQAASGWGLSRAPTGQIFSQEGLSRVTCSDWLSMCHLSSAIWFRWWQMRVWKFVEVWFKQRAMGEGEQKWLNGQCDEELNGMKYFNIISLQHFYRQAPLTNYHLKDLHASAALFFCLVPGRDMIQNVNETQIMFDDFFQS